MKYAENAALWAYLSLHLAGGFELPPRNNFTTFPLQTLTELQYVSLETCQYFSTFEVTVLLWTFALGFALDSKDPFFIE